MSHTHRALVHRPRIRRRPPVSVTISRRKAELQAAIQAVDVAMEIHHLALAAPRGPTDDTTTCVDLYNAWTNLRRIIAD